ncbi:MAG TPA: 3-hydroxyacyl-CoA dehydrogenase family protein [Actinomycetes bacterium]|nr:3-hydroxyacyl-CoA dehydrogenase family protein [Actinomycetes bacterium]
MSGERVTVVGAGLMGHGIAQVFAEADRHVAVWDPDPVARTSVAARVSANLRATGRARHALDRIQVRGSLEEAVGDAEVVIEAAPEDLPLKQELFERLDQLAPAGAMLATNTSVMSVGEIGARARRRERVLGTHWWNPPYLIPLVEVVQAEATAEDVVRRMIGLLAEVGKTPVHVRRDVPGFVGNRLQHALWREAVAIVAAGVCDAETVDTVVKQSFGRRLGALGPLENADLVGLDLTLAIHEYVLPHLDRTPGPSPLLRGKVARGELGMKTGQGFRTWPPGAAEAVRDRLLRFLVDAGQASSG